MFVCTEGEQEHVTLMTHMALRFESLPMQHSLADPSYSCFRKDATSLHDEVQIGMACDNCCDMASPTMVSWGCVSVGASGMSGSASAIGALSNAVMTHTDRSMA